MDYEARVTRNGVSANHLLNFSMPERERTGHHYRKKKKNAAPRTQTEYLHANYRFVIAPLDPDAVVPTWDLEALAKWSSVEQVLLWYDIESPHTCPICMDTFRAPKITKCGHIFCWPCILRYLSMTDKYWRRCPMCFESVQKGHLRSVQLHQLQTPPHVGSDVTFQFLERPKSSMFPQRRVRSSAEVKAGYAGADSSSCSEVERKRYRTLPRVNDVDATFSRILEATPEYLQELLHSEICDLQSMDAEFRSSGDLDNLPFVEEAMRNTSGRLTKSDDFSHGTYGSISANSTATAAKPKPHENESGDAYSFYQIANGTYVVLHPLNMKCLMKEFSDEHQHKQDGERAEDKHQQELEKSAWTQEAANLEPLPVNRYELLPDQIHGRVLDIEHVVMDEEAQKRYRFLNHLPRFCDFYVCELDLTSQLSPSTLNSFRNELKKRLKQRKQKLKLQNATTPSSPIFKSNASTFSLEQEGTMWPSPYEQALTESLEEFTVSNSLSTELGSDFPTALNDEQSFARVTENSGYFPALGRDGVSEARPLVTDPIEIGVVSAWGNPSINQSAVTWESGKGSKKKGAGKKGVSVFSTTQRRSYR